jgi:hypothetical protein
LLVAQGGSDVIRRLIIRVCGVLLAAGLCACGPIQFVSQVTIRAEKSVAAARLHKAHIYAKYEYYGAEAYLEQAKHRAGFGDFQTSYRYGKKAEKMANKAVKLTKLRREEESDVGDRSKKGKPAPERP